MYTTIIISNIDGKWLLNNKAYKDLNVLEKGYFNQFWKDMKKEMEG